MDKLAFEAELRREGYRIVNTGIKPNLAIPNHCHDGGVKAMVLGGEVTVTRDGRAETFRGGERCEIPAGCQPTKVGPEGVAYVVGKGPSPGGVRGLNRPGGSGRRRRPGGMAGPGRDRADRGGRQRRPADGAPRPEVAPGSH